MTGAKATVRHFLDLDRLDTATLRHILDLGLAYQAGREAERRGAAAAKASRWR